ncbi:MAG: shikimate kinase [Clostridiaceae bacterium]|nr:shikimate kinase [Clostridiaceae bacterium]
MYGLLGKKLTHSYSPAIHGLFGLSDYVLFEKDENELEDFLKNGDWQGINVTIPYKKAVMPYLDWLDDSAEKVGCVNTVLRRGNKLCGYNTDYYGFDELVNSSGIDFEGKKILILGTGGASLAVNAVCKNLNAGEIVFISRSGENNYENISRHADADIIINTTPVGMYPNNLVSPVKLNCFTELSAVFDVIYNPLKTKLSLDAEKLGIPAFSGLPMLVFQAKKANELFRNTTISEEKARSVLREISFLMKNIILIGMPACGKSSVGKKLAEFYGREFLDCDSEIEKRTGRTPAGIIKADGEEKFRIIETQVLSDICKLSGKVIATGGGAVTKAENFDIIKQNAVVVFINRDPSLLSTDGRPLSQKEGVEKLYKTRLPLYRSFADYEIDGNGSVDGVSKRIEEVLK